MNHGGTALAATGTLTHMTDDLLARTVAAADAVRGIDQRRREAVARRDALLVECLNGTWTPTTLSRQVDLSVTYLKEIKKRGHP